MVCMQLNMCCVQRGHYGELCVFVSLCVMIWGHGATSVCRECFFCGVRNVSSVVFIIGGV